MELLSTMAWIVLRFGTCASAMLRNGCRIANIAINDVMIARQCDSTLDDIFGKDSRAQAGAKKPRSSNNTRWPLAYWYL